MGFLGALWLKCIAKGKGWVMLSFDIMPERNVVTRTAMIDGYMRLESFKDGFELLFIRLSKSGFYAGS